MLRICFLFLPFAFNGPCSCESGPKKIAYCLNKMILRNTVLNEIYYEMQLLNQSYSMSAYDYQKGVYNKLNELTQSFDKIIVLGGNHLACLPLYLYKNDTGSTIICFDAHRDYINNSNLLTHASFLRYLYGSVNSKMYLFGFRDIINNNDSKYSPFDKEYPLSEINSFIKIIKEEKLEKSYLDIDMDVFDLSFFPYVTCKRENGLGLDNFKKICSSVNFKKIDLISLSEYVPLFDQKNRGSAAIIELIMFFISIWNEETYET